MSTLKGKGIFAPGDVLKNPTTGETYEVVEYFGEGGMGEVYKGKNSKGSFVLIKVAIEKGDEHDDIRKERLKFEAEALKHFDSDFVVRFIDYYTENSLPILVIEFLEGMDLEKYRKTTNVSEQEAVEIVAKILQALDMVHQAGVLHRDLKPQNVFYNPNTGRITLIDFGLAKIYDQGVPYTPQNKASMTWATPGYAPPEVTGQGKFLWSIPGELYSVGAIFYFLLTGYHPTPGDQTPVGLNPHFKDSNISTELAKIVMKSTRRDFTERYQTANDFYKVLTGQKLSTPVFPYLIVNGKKELITKDLLKEPLVIGRSEKCDIVIHDPYPHRPAIARQHAKITAVEINGMVKYKIEEFKPNTNGVLIMNRNTGKWIRADYGKPKFINTGDIIALGYHEWFGPYLTMSFIVPDEMKTQMTS